MPLVHSISKDGTLRSYGYLDETPITYDIVTSGLAIHLDAANTASYSGTGTTWSDLSGNNYNFTLTSSAAYVGTGVKYMDFNANRATIASGNDVPVTGNVTAIVWTRIKNNTGDWRTLFRANSTGGNHQVIVESGSYRLGMYSGGYRDSGFLQSSLPGYNTSQWNMLVWRFSTVSPYYIFSYNDTPGTIRGSSTDSLTQFNQGIYSLGAYQGGGQYWGDIAQLLFYNRILTDDEILQNWNATRSRFGV